MLRPGRAEGAPNSSSQRNELDVGLGALTAQCESEMRSVVLGRVCVCRLNWRIKQSNAHLQL